MPQAPMQMTQPFYRKVQARLCGCERLALQLQLRCVRADANVRAGCSLRSALAQGKASLTFSQKGAFAKMLMQLSSASEEARCAL